MAKTPRATLRLVDRLVLVVAWMATSGVVYVLGYYVGKGTPDHHGAMEERTVRLPVTAPAPPEGQRPKDGKEFPSFYQALPAGERPIDVARGTPVTAPPQGATPTTVPRGTTTPTTLAPPRATTPTTIAATRVTTTPTATLPRAATTPTTVVPRTIVPGEVTTTLVPRPTAPPATIVPRSASHGGFTVEASPTRSRSEAETLLGTLRRRGYDATMVQVERDGDTWYRLRVGRYATAEQATETMRRLRDVEGVTHVFVASE
jgi:cell division septation protein DedD